MPYLCVAFDISKSQRAIGLEFEYQSAVDLSACEVIGHGILCVIDVGHPIIRVYIVDTQQVKAV